MTLPPLADCGVDFSMNSLTIASVTSGTG